MAWNNLVASKRNRRKVKANGAGLALNLAVDGLLQNLVVLPREDGKYEVIAGERRRRAIVQLVKSRTWERDVSIPCEVREPEAATSISYAENAQRVGMHPADSIRAFAALRSEEHTSELQSLMRISYAVFCLKKKTNTQETSITQQIIID